MRVGIGAYALEEKTGGHANYVRSLIHALGRLNLSDEYSLFFTTDPTPETAGGLPRQMRRVGIMTRPLTLPVPYWQGGLASTRIVVPTGAESRAVRREKVDVMHVQLAAPLLFGAPLVLTLHDLAFERYPQFFTPDVAMKLRIRVPLTVRRAAFVVVDADYTKHDLIRRYKTPEDKVVVAPCAADPMYAVLHDDAPLRAVRDQYGTGERFILCVGDLQPRKNLRTLIDAYVRLRRAGTTTVKLVLVGRVAWLTDDIFTAARESGYTDDLVFTGYVPDADLVALYNAATVFVYPSVFEGFGLPLLEAMACGTPVVCGNRSALPETVGEAALMVDPEDAEAMATAIGQVLNDEATATELCQRGPEQAARFSWDATARIIHDVYWKAFRPLG